MEKLHEYQGWTGRVHEFRDNVRTKYTTWREEHPETMIELVKNVAKEKATGGGNTDENDFSHIYRTKTRSELIRVSAAVMGIEFSYAAETAFVSPTLLKIGVDHQHMTLVWALSPLVGFFLTPILGSLSDRCRLSLGRRRPFIFLLSIGVFLGLLLVPNGEDIGYSFGDYDPYDHILNKTITPISLTKAKVAHRTSASNTISNSTINEFTTIQATPSHGWGIFFTILGTVLLDFDADACQSPARAYLLDVTLPEDHARGLSTFTIMAGLGGFMGYSLGGINWDETAIGILLGGHVRAVFTLVTFIFIFCVTITMTSFREIPLWRLEAQPVKLMSDQLDNNEDEVIKNDGEKINPAVKENVDGDGERTVIANEETQATQSNELLGTNQTAYGALPVESGSSMDIPTRKQRYAKPMLTPEYAAVPGANLGETQFNEYGATSVPIGQGEDIASLSHYLMSIVLMPHSMRMVCLTNLFCWMAHVCYSLYFTDFVGEAVFGGDPKASIGSVKQILYEDGVRFGCWGMAMYSLSCACYSLVIERLIKQYGAKKVYVGGLLFYCTGMTLMALTRAQASVIIFSWAAGVMYSTLFTMPYLLIAHYHAQGTFEILTDGTAKVETEIRGLGTDIAIVSSMVFLAQFILSLCMGTIVSWSGTTTAVVSVASFLSLCGALSATQIMYLDL